ncbi:MAG: hypothetical protein HY529_05205 [Chloroflexi bacterium]|nr:hypothetical protein [Chloroflexota bacterium]
MIKHILVLLVAILVLSLPAPVLAAEPDNGVIEGQLVNGTKGGSSVAEQVVTLKTSLNDTETGSTPGKTDAQGKFIFTNLTTASGYSYQVIPSYQEADYYSEKISFTGGETTKSLEITVYDSTMSVEAIKLDTTHMIIYAGQDKLEVVEFFRFSNQSDRTYIGSGEKTASGTRRTVELPLLPDKTAADPEYGGELMVCCVIPSEKGFFDTMPIYPGFKELSYSYNVKSSSGKYVFSRPINYPTGQYNFLIQGDGIQVNSNRLTKGEPLSFKNSIFSNFSGTDLAPGENLDIQISGLPKPSRGPILWIILTIVGLSVSSVLLVRRRRLQPVLSRDNGELNQQRLLVELAQLDDDFEGGQIPEDSYRKLRAEKKSQLVSLMQRPEKNRGSK